MRRFHSLLPHSVLLALAVLLSAAPLLAYTIYLKDGSTLLAREKYQVQGNVAVITLPNGAQSRLPLAQIDVPKTNASNASDYGDATVLGGPPRAQATAAPHSPSLSEVLAQRRNGLPAAPAPAPPPRPAPAVATAVTAAASGNALARTPAGFVDFLRAPRTPISRVELGTTIGQLLRGHGLESAGIYDGSTPRRVLVEITTNSEGAVFQGIAATAQAMVDLDAKEPGAIDGIELFLATDRRARAGQFFITPERARELTTKQIDLTGFFIKYVEF